MTNPTDNKPGLVETLANSIQRMLATYRCDMSEPDYASDLAELIEQNEDLILEALRSHERMREALEGSATALEEAANVLADGHARFASIIRGYAERARTALQETDNGAG